MDGALRRLARDYERLSETLAGLHVVVFAILMLQCTATLAAGHNSVYICYYFVESHA